MGKKETKELEEAHTQLNMLQKNNAEPQNDILLVEGKNYDLPDPIELKKEEDQVEQENFTNNEYYNAETAYYLIYDVEPKDYADIDIQSLNFSKRLENRLIKEGYLTVENLLKSNDEKLGTIRGFGKTCFDELHQYLATLKQSSFQKKGKQIYSNITKELVPFKEQIIRGDFSFLAEFKFGKASMAYIEQLREAYRILDFDLIEEFLNKTPAAIQVYKMLKGFVNKTISKKTIQKIINEIPENRVSEKASWLITCFTSDIEWSNYLTSILPEDNASLEEFIIYNASRLNCSDLKVRYFIDWCKYDVHQEVNHFFHTIIKNERELKIIQGRTEGKTLDVLGRMFGITKERIRQIEKKTSKKFNIWQKHNRIMYKIFADMNEMTGISSMELIDFLGEVGREFVYLMKNSEDQEFVYDKQLDMFTFEASSIYEQIQVYVDALPDTFPARKFDEFIKSAETEYEYPSKMVSAVIEDNYEKTGATYHRFRLSLENIYSDIMAQYYQNGIHIYDETALKEFRRHVYDAYEMDISDKSDHAIGAVISRLGILCGRGIYKLRQKKPYITKDLAEKIHDYIQNSSAPIFMTNTLFSIFEDELVEQGVDNKYYLQGILRDLYGDEWIFRRDYISKDESYTSVYSSIVGFIRKSQYPVLKEDIKKAFPGVTEIVINFSISDHNILNLFGQYIHSSRLKLSNTDIQYLRESIEQSLIGRDVCHCKDIYEYINNDYPELLTNNFVNFPFGLYSILEYLFDKNYNFSRPYISRENATIERVDDVIRDMIAESETIAIGDIMAFAKEHHFQINSILEYIDSCNNTHLLMNNEELGSINYIGITEEIAKSLERLIADEIDGTVPIYQLQCISSLPKINVDWNAWLIYSTLKKWGVSLEVGVSNSQFRQSFPLVAPIGKLDLSCTNTENRYYDGKIIQADDLTKIDELIEDYVLEGLEDFDDLKGFED